MFRRPATSPLPPNLSIPNPLISVQMLMEGVPHSAPPTSLPLPHSAPLGPAGWILGKQAQCRPHSDSNWLQFPATVLLVGHSGAGGVQYKPDQLSFCRWNRITVHHHDGGVVVQKEQMDWRSAPRSHDRVEGDERVESNCPASLFPSLLPSLNLIRKPQQPPETLESASVGNHRHLLEVGHGVWGS